MREAREITQINVHLYSVEEVSVKNDKSTFCGSNYLTKEWQRPDYYRNIFIPVLSFQGSFTIQ